ncbi:MAG: type I-B CRISPR-associated protein Cas5 [Thermotogae bacterium]|nr:type I-B CRISPR-associated protein Cas5 [Thermotogota bacterium]
MVFDLLGKFAHFRVFYANANALTYTFPPRTTLTGILASILGRSRDTYYEDMGPENLKLALRVVEPVRKRMVAVNYVKTESFPAEVKITKRAARISVGYFETYPTRMEILMSKGGGFLRFRVYLSAKIYSLHEELKDRLRSNSPHYSLYMGISEFLAWTEFVGEYEAQDVITDEVLSVVPERLFESLDFSSLKEAFVEKIPLHFRLNGGLRAVSETATFINSNGHAVKFKKDVPAVKVGDETIIWME